MHYFSRRAAGASVFLNDGQTYKPGGMGFGNVVHLAPSNNLAKLPQGICSKLQMATTNGCLDECVNTKNQIYGQW